MAALPTRPTNGPSALAPWTTSKANTAVPHESSTYPSAPLSTVNSPHQSEISSTERTIVDAITPPTLTEKHVSTAGGPNHAGVDAERQVGVSTGAEIKLSQKRKWFLLLIFSIAQVSQDFLFRSSSLFNVFKVIDRSKVSRCGQLRWPLCLYRRHPPRPQHPLRIVFLGHRKS